MEREAFRQRMQQYKQARENNPQLKYWDWKKYADGGIVDEDPPQNTSERPITNFDPKGDPYNPTQKDFRIKIDNAVTPSQEITNHEINHFNQYIHQDNPSWNKSELDKITKQFKGKLRDKNPIDPENTSYFMNWMEQNAYGINMLDRLKELNIKPTKQNILKYLKSLPDTDSIKKTALQFKNLDDYIKWLNTMPLADNGNINEIENYNFA